MSEITLKANRKLDGSIATTKYWRSGASSEANNFLFVNNYNDNNFKSRIIFYFNEATFLNQTVTKATLKLNVDELHSSSAKTAPISVKIGLDGANSNNAYNSASFIKQITGLKENEAVEIELNLDSISLINKAIKEKKPVSFYFGPGQNGEVDYGCRFYGYNHTSSSKRPVLNLTYSESASTGTIITTVPRFGSEITLKINRGSENYIHTINWRIGENLIGSNEKNKEDEVKFIFDRNKEVTYLGKENTEIKASCEIITFLEEEDGTTELGTSTIEFMLYAAENAIVEWNSSPTISSSDGKGVLVSGIHGAKIFRGEASCKDNADVSRYRIRIDSCGINSIVELEPEEGEFFTPVLKTNEDKNFTVYISVKDSRNRYSPEKEVSKLCYSYFPPRISNYNIYRAKNEEGTADEIGAYLFIKCSYNYRVIGNENSIKNILITCVPKEGKPKTYQQTSPSGNSLTYAFNEISSELSYSVTIEIEDQFSKNTLTIPIPEGRYLIHIPRGGKGIGIGTTGEENYIRLGWPVKGLEIKDGSLSLGDGKMTGQLTLSNAAYIRGPEDQLLLSYNCSSASGAIDGTCLGYHGNITTIRGNSLKYYNGSNTYDILHSGNYNNYPPSLSELYYSAGEAIEFTDGLFHGFVTNSKSTIYLIIPLSKRLDKISSVTIVNMTGHIRNTGGYALQDGLANGGNDFISSSSTITSTIIRENSSNTSNSIKLSLTRKNGQNWVLSNNAYVSFVPISFKMEFR